MDISKVSEKQFFLRCPQDKKQKKTTTTAKKPWIKTWIATSQQKMTCKIEMSAGTGDSGRELFAVPQNTIKMYLLISQQEMLKSMLTFTKCYNQ